MRIQISADLLSNDQFMLLVDDYAKAKKRLENFLSTENVGFYVVRPEAPTAKTAKQLPTTNRSKKEVAPCPNPSTQN